MERDEVVQGIQQLCAGDETQVAKLERLVRIGEWSASRPNMQTAVVVPLPRPVLPADDRRPPHYYQLDKYQEQPTIIDSAVESMLEHLFTVIRVAAHRARQESADAGPAFKFHRQCGQSHILAISKVRGWRRGTPSVSPLTFALAALQVVYAICKVRGVKAAAKHFPHEIADLEPALVLLSCQDPADYE